MGKVVLNIKYRDKSRNYKVDDARAALIERYAEVHNMDVLDAIPILLEMGLNSGRNSIPFDKQTELDQEAI